MAANLPTQTDLLQLARHPSKTARATLSWLRNTVVNPRERRFLELALLLDEPADRLQNAMRRDLNWRRVVELAEAAHVLPMLAHALVEGGLEDRVEASARETLREAYEQNTARNAMLMHAAATVQETLAGAGIESVLIKGAAMVAAYPQLAARYQVDVDVLVRAGDFERAEAALVRAGCARLYGDDVSHRYHLALTAPNGIVVELHFGMVDSRLEPDAALGAVLEHSRTVPWNGATLRVASSSDLLGIACEHALGRHAGNPIFVPRLVSDFCVLASSDDSHWDHVHDHYDHHGSVARALALVEHIRGGRPFAWDLGVALTVELMFVPPSVWSASDLWSFGEAVLAQGAGTTVRKVFPRRSYLAMRYDVEPSSPHLTWLYAHRLMVPLARIAQVEESWDGVARRILGREP